jgi:predicted metal-dependent HD superfamily phosphohydrolase
LGVTKPDETVYADLLAHYQETHRHYHTQQHLRECLQQLAKFEGSAERPAEIAIALWFHDAIYDTGRQDNERKSADWARLVLSNAGVALEVVDRVDAMIMATCHKERPTTQDACLLVDIDLSIFAAPPARYAQYEKQVRREYGWVPEPVFQPKRRKVLMSFLGRDHIFDAIPLREHYEVAARANLIQALSESR